MRQLPGLILLCLALPTGNAKWVEGRIDTKENWVFLSRFCFLSLNGQFEYLIEYDKEMGIPNLLLYYDDSSQWPAVYHSSKSCKEREAVLNKGQNQVIRLSHWYPDTEYSGCIMTKANKELPASKSTPTPSTTKPTKQTISTIAPHPSFYDQFLKTDPTTPITNFTTNDTNFTTPSSNFTTPASNLAASGINVTTWYEMPVENVTLNEELWEHIEPQNNSHQFEDLKDVEILFDDQNERGHKIKRSTDRELIQRYRRRRLNAEPNQKGASTKERLVVSCHNSRRFRSARERWWFIAVSNCDGPRGLDIKYKFLMTNGPDGDFWHEHFSADEFYVLPVLTAYTFAYIAVMIAVAICSVELKTRHLLHSTYKLFCVSVGCQHLGVLVHCLTYVRYATHGVVDDAAKVTAQFFIGLSEMAFLLLLLLLAKGYTVTRGRLKLGFTVKLTIFMCIYFSTYVVLFIYQAKAFDPGEVLYLYESPAGYGIVVLRMAAWCVFTYATFRTVKKYPQKTMFYCPFFVCGTLWFIAGPLFILTANSFIDKWVRESVVNAVLLFITFSGHIMFMLLTLPVFANKNFPYHVRTTQIGIMEVTNNPTIDGFGHGAYAPSNGTSQTVIIPLTRRTEELIGNIYSQYMASAPPLSLESESRLNGSIPKRIDSSPNNMLLPQNSTETNNSDDIKPTIQKDEIFTVESQISKMDTPIAKVLPVEKSHLTNRTQMLLPERNLPINGEKRLPVERNIPMNREVSLDKNVPINGEMDNGFDLPNVLRSRRNILEPIKREEAPVPLWSLAKGPAVVGMLKKTTNLKEDDPPAPIQSNGKKVPAVRNGLKQSSGEISTILEGRVQSYVSDATVDLFTVGLRNEKTDQTQK